MARVLHGMPVGTLPEPGELNRDDQVIAYRQSDGMAYRTDVGNLATEGVDLLNQVYPIGSIYMSVNDTSPGDFLGGEWSRIRDCFLLAAGSHDAGTTGGEETVTLSTSNIPSHTHSIPSHSHSLPSHTHSLPSHTHSMPSHTHSIPSLSGTAASAGAHTHSVGTVSNNTVGGSSRRIASRSNSDDELDAVFSAGAHTHSVTTNSSTTGSTSGTSGSTSGTSGSTSGTSGSASGTTGTTGSGAAHNNMPPYLSVYMWQRVA